MEDPLKAARKRAERAVEDMPEGPLKIAAFQTILAKLLAESTPATGSQAPVERAGVRRQQEPDTLTGRVMAIGADGFFKEQRSLGEVREALGSRGWHYPVTTLSGAMQALVRQRRLRRERVLIRNKQLWKYSNP